MFLIDGENAGADGKSWYNFLFYLHELNNLATKVLHVHSRFSVNCRFWQVLTKQQNSLADDFYWL